MGNLGGGAGGRMWARSELRHRWRSLIALGLLAGVTAGIASAAVAGARRSDTAWARLREVSLASDAIVFASQAGIHDPDWDPVVALPYVEAAGAFGFADGVLVSSSLGDELDGEYAGLTVSQFGDWLTDVDRPRIIDGRLPDSGDPSEIVVEIPSGATDPEIPMFAVGDELTIRFFTAEQAVSVSGDPAGPTLTLHVVGIAESPLTMAAIPSLAGSPLVGPAFRDAYPEAVVPFSNLMVRLHDPEADIRRFENDVERLFPGQGVPIADLGDAAKRVTNGTDLERTGLLLFALAVATAGTVIVGPALTRSVRASRAELPALSAVGIDRRGASGALALPHLLSAVTAFAVSLALAIALSPRFPIGLARRVDPDVGVHLDVAVVVGGAALMALLLAGTVLATAWRAAGPASASGVERPSAVVTRLRNAGAPVSVVVGAGLALEPGEGQRTLPTRSALGGAVVGVLGLVGALVFLGGLDDATGHPERFGAVWDLEASWDGDDLDPYLALPGMLAADPDVVSVARVGRVSGSLDDLVVPFYAIDPTSGPPLSFVTLEGRAPERSGEIVLGPDTASLAGLDVGDDVELGDGASFRVVGLGLLPTTPHSSFDQGAWVVPDDVTAAIPLSFRQSLGTTFGLDLTDDELFRTVFFTRGFAASTVRDGVDPEVVAGRLDEQADETISVTPAEPPADQISMRNVRSLPVLFSVFAPLVALGALLHVTSSVLHRRRADLAILRVLGCTPRQTGACIAWQSTVLALIGLFIGVPLGVAFGRTAWRLVAEEIPIVHVTAVAAVPLLLLLPAAIVAANIVTLRPAWRTSRLSAAEAFRAD